MCGIAAVWQRDGRPCRSADVLAMRDIQIHRGPDDAGIHIDGPIGLGHRRLSILDLSAAGHQPMSNEDGSIWLVFNGEIYNYIELASTLRDHRQSGKNRGIAWTPGRTIRAGRIRWRSQLCDPQANQRA